YVALSLQASQADPATLIFEGKRLEGFSLDAWLRSRTLLGRLRLARKIQELLRSDLKTHFHSTVPLQEAGRALQRTAESCDVRRLHSRDNFNGNTDRKTELAVRAPLIDGDFGKSVGVLIPEGRAWLPLAERPRALQNPCRDDESCGGQELGYPQASHGIAEMIDVDDLAEVVWPVCLAVRVVLVRPARGRLTAGQHGRNRCEEIAPVEACR